MRSLQDRALTIDVAAKRIRYSTGSPRQRIVPLECYHIGALWAVPGIARYAVSVMGTRALFFARSDLRERSYASALFHAELRKNNK